MKNKILKEFLDAVKSKIPNYKKRMRAGCSEEDLIELESIIKRKLPETYRDLLLNFNGEQQEAVLLMGGFFLLSVKRVLREYEFIKTNVSEETEVFQPNLIQPYHYQRDRIPFADDGSGNFICIDYEPNIEGKEGQIIYLPLSEPEPLSVIFNDFNEYLQFLTNAIIEGKIQIEEYDDEEGKTYNFVKTWRDDWTDIAEQFVQK